VCRNTCRSSWKVSIVVVTLSLKLKCDDKLNTTPEHQILWKSIQLSSYCYMHADRHGKANRHFFLFSVWTYQERNLQELCTSQLTSEMFRRSCLKILMYYEGCSLRMYCYGKIWKLPQRTLFVCGHEEFVILFQLSRSWLGERAVDKLVPMQHCSLLVTLRFVPSEVTLRRVPTARTAGLFGAKIQQVCK
jgi:hypothetical protein